MYALDDFFSLYLSSISIKKELLNNPKHLVLETSHPSPFSARRGFMGCNHFKEMYIQEIGFEPTEEELVNLNPQTDEEEELDIEGDDSVEVIEDDTYIDSKGRKRSNITFF